MDKKDWRSDNSVSHQTLTAGDVLRRHNETYQNLLPAVNVNNAENIVKTEIAIKEVLSTLPMDINRSALCLSFREDKPFKVLQNKISYIAPDSKEYMFKINTEAVTGDDPYYFIFINGTEQNDDRLSERFLLPYSFPAGFFEYKNRIFLTFSDGEEEQKLTTKESELLRLLCLNVNKVLERNYALKNIWADDNYFNARSMDVYITKLRKHLKKDPSVEIINVHGKGYKLIL